MMKYKLLGRSNLSVSEISFGCMSLGTDHTQNVNLLHEALDNGINYFDTADIYQKGQNEITVGKAFKDKRDKVVLATKVGNQLRADGSGWDWNPTKDYILRSVDESLTRLQTDYIDLYQLHGGTIQDPIDEIIEAFELLKKNGKIRHYGISSIRPNVIHEYVRRSNIVSVMMQYSLLDRRPEESCLDLLHENNISVLVRGSVAKGLLINKPSEAFLDHTAEEVNEAKALITALADTKHDALDITLGYVLSHPAVTTSVIGIRTHEQLKECLRVAKSLPILKSETIEKLKRSIRQNFYTEHR